MLTKTWLKNYNFFLFHAKVAEENYINYVFDINAYNCMKNAINNNIQKLLKKKPIFIKLVEIIFDCEIKPNVKEPKIKKQNGAALTSDGFH